MKRYLNLAILAGILAVIGFAYCSGKNSGRANVEDKQYKEAAERANKAAKILLQKIASQDKVIADQKKKLEDAKKPLPAIKTRYVHLRDTLVITDTAQVKVALAVADSVIGMQQVVIERQDTVIKSQDVQIASLKQLNKMREEELVMLNRRLALMVRGLGRSKRQGILLGVGAASFAVVLSQSLK